MFVIQFSLNRVNGSKIAPVLPWFGRIFFNPWQHQILRTLLDIHHDLPWLETSIHRKTHAEKRGIVLSFNKSMLGSKGANINWTAVPVSKTKLGVL